MGLFSSIPPQYPLPPHPPQQISHLPHVTSSKVVKWLQVQTLDFNYYAFSFIGYDANLLFRISYAGSLKRDVRVWTDLKKNIKPYNNSYLDMAKSLFQKSALCLFWLLYRYHSYEATEQIQFETEDDMRLVKFSKLTKCKEKTQIHPFQGFFFSEWTLLVVILRDFRTTAFQRWKLIRTLSVIGRALENSENVS